MRCGSLILFLGFLLFAAARIEREQGGCHADSHDECFFHFIVFSRFVFACFGLILSAWLVSQSCAALGLWQPGFTGRKSTKIFVRPAFDFSYGTSLPWLVCATSFGMLSALDAKLGQRIFMS